MSRLRIQAIGTLTNVLVWKSKYCASPPLTTGPMNSLLIIQYYELWCIPGHAYARDQCNICSCTLRHPFTNWSSHPKEPVEEYTPDNTLISASLSTSSGLDFLYVKFGCSYRQLCKHVLDSLYSSHSDVVSIRSRDMCHDLQINSHGRPLLPLTS